MLLVACAGLLFSLVPRPARAFGEVGAFDPRILLTGSQTDAAYPSAPGRWSWELVQRTSAPARLKPSFVRADSPEISNAPFVYWSGREAVRPLTASEVSGLRRFFTLGGVMFVDDAGVTSTSNLSEFGSGARRELARVLPQNLPISLGPDHVIFRSFYLLSGAEGRVAGKKNLDAIVRGGAAQVIFSEYDVGGAMARGVTGVWEQSVTPGGDAQRERALRLAINIAMYALCSNYKDDQVHAPFLMRRRAVAFEPSVK